MLRLWTQVTTSPTASWRSWSGRRTISPHTNSPKTVTGRHSLSSQASGLKGIALNLDIKFSDWNKDFSVAAPKGATPLNSGGLLGGFCCGA